MAHGAGGKATQTLIEGLLVPALAREGETLEEMGDAGVVTIDDLGIALTTDSYVVRPIRFPGGSIGELAVNGTANDLAVAGARPKALSLSLILEEGLPADELRTQVEAIAAAAEAADVEIATGDTKVVERGHADGMYICTAGIGKVDPSARLSPRGISPGDRIIVSGTVGDHGSAIMLARDEFSLDAEIRSDTRPSGRRSTRCSTPRATDLHCMRDATRGGVASVLNELARASRCRDQRARGRRARSTRRSPAPPRCSGSTRCTSPTRESSWPSSRRIGRRRHCAALRSVPGCEEAAEIGEVKTRAAGHGARRDRIRRQAGDGPAGRRPAAQDLLKLDNH